MTGTGLKGRIHASKACGLQESGVFKEGKEMERINGRRAFGVQHLFLLLLPGPGELDSCM